MPWPDFTELSFGYCFLRELETKYTRGGRFPKAPDFISQHAEKTEGYDVKVAMTASVPLFIQLKRSMVMTNSNAHEYSSPHFAGKPVFRMNLHRKGNFSQHLALQRLEQAGNRVIYATSQIEDPQELVTHTKHRTMVTQASALFSPSSINLPTLNEPHYVSFYANQNWAVLFSKKGERFERGWSDSSTWLSDILKSPQSREENEKAMKAVVQLLLSTVSQDLGNVPRSIRSALEELDSPAAQASVLAHYLLDAHLTFLKPIKGGK